MDSFIYSLNATVPIFLVMIVGWIIKRLGVIDDHFVNVANKYVFKVFTQANGDNTGERTSITVSAQPECSFSVSEDQNCLYMKTGEAMVRMSKDNCGLAFLDKDGNVRLSAAQGERRTGQ